jgi:hypothetical protein
VSQAIASSTLSAAREIWAPSAMRSWRSAPWVPSGRRARVLCKLEQGALEAAAVGLRERVEEVIDEAGLGLQRAAEVVEQLAGAAEGVEAGVELAAQEMLGGLDERAAGVALAAFAEALGEGVEDVDAGGGDEGLLDEGEGEAEEQAGVVRAGLDRCL